ncbi:lysophospholipase [Cryptococcus wingfieldii CBS 7118]|uniref:Lysophospholipase n=1 Tax=Cryptococcus wingfieldii CBS 7118 TaxID=1295528 RepID=A0A1E3JR38_9TREE|nr:lysophospholipase [Cryptococcus wingfieldii CBS 7118]ODO03330.1 lysophospholipase [Cryptococcus wingfieldii CBS 7118]
MPFHNPIWEVLEPHLVRMGLYKVQDPTYGRYLLPNHPPHLALVEDPTVSHNYRRVFLPPTPSFKSYHEAWDTTQIIHAENVNLVKDELASGVKWGGRWVTYSTWEMTSPPEGGWEGAGRGVGKDLVLVHGLGDYGLRYAPHIKFFLKSGFRVIVLDLPSYGRSTGINSYLPSLLLLPSAVHVVLTDLAQNDIANGRKQKKVFLSGASMGGWTILYYLLKYPPTNNTEAVVTQGSTADVTLPEGGKGYDDLERPRADEKVRPQVAGAFVLCPMVEVSKESRPNIILEYIGRAIVFFGGSLPLAKSVRGNVSDDPRVEEDFFADRKYHLRPTLCYHGMLRVGTGLACLEGMTELEKRAHEIDVPIRLVHGNKDRATSHEGTLRLFDRLLNDDKELEIYDGYEHVMLRLGSNEEDDKQRQKVLDDMRSWLLQRC